ALTSWLVATDIAQAFARVAPWLAGIAILAWIVALRGRSPGQPSEAPAAARWRALWWLLIAMIVVRLIVLGSEALLRPTFPWDAWSAWAIKPKTWYLLDHFVPYVDAAEWLSTTINSARTSAVW